jgi:hypothetical protein
MGTAAQQNTSHGRATKGTAVVTGASSGLGAVFADRLASRGYDLILVARRADRLRALETRLSSQYSISAKAAVADLAAKADLDSLIEKIRNDSSITMLVNDAGTASMKPLTSIGDAELHPVFPPPICLPAPPTQANRIVANLPSCQHQEGERSRAPLTSEESPPHKPCGAAHVPSSVPMREPIRSKWYKMESAVNFSRSSPSWTRLNVIA